jgi:prevent-host-death family protein
MWSVQDAKNRFTGVVEAAQREPQTVSQDGKPIVVIVAADEYQRLAKPPHPKRPSLIDLPPAMPEEVDVEF